MGFTLGGRVLLIDENPLDQAVIKSVLNEDGYIVDDTDNQIEAIRLVLRNKPDLLIIDSKTFNGLGAEFIQNIRQDENFYSRIPILVIKDSAKKADRNKYLEAGANKFLPKPLNIVTLLEVVRDLRNDEEYPNIQKTG